MENEWGGTAVIWYPVLKAGLRTDLGIADPHSTVVFFEDTTGIDPAMVYEAMQGMTEVYQLVDVTGFELFGPNLDIPVLTIEHTLLKKNYNKLVSELTMRGIKYSDRYSYKPHVSIGPVFLLDNMPWKLVLGPPELRWEGSTYTP